MPNEQLLDEMMKLDGASHEFEVRRETIELGRSFSKEAMNALNESVLLWIGSRIMRRWNETSEPPTVVKVTVTVEVQ